MKIYSIEKSMLAKLKPLIADYQFKPYKEYEIEQSLLDRYVIEEISDILSRESGFVFVGEEMGELVGLATLEKLDWDTKHFGIEMAKIRHLIARDGYPKALKVKRELISHLLAECREKRISHISARIYKEDISSIHALENKGFQLMDVIVTYYLDLRKMKPVRPRTQCRIRQFKQEDMPKLKEIVMECFGVETVATDHFHADPTLPKEKSDELYVQWIIESIREPSDTILIAELNRKLIGFTACRVHRSLGEKLGIRFGTIILTGVIPSARGKSVATSLSHAALQWFADKVDIVERGGQVSNYAVQRVWNRSGFRIVRSQCTFHWSRFDHYV